MQNELVVEDVVKDRSVKVRFNWRYIVYFYYIIYLFAGVQREMLEVLQTSRLRMMLSACRVQSVTHVCQFVLCVV